MKRMLAVPERRIVDTILPRFYRMDGIGLEGKIQKIWNGLTVVYTFRISSRKYADADHDLLDCFGWSAETLEKIAYRNLQKERPVIFRMADFPGMGDTNRQTVVVTDDGCTFGASMILRHDVCEEISDRLGGSFWIVPIGFRECLCEPADEDKDVLLQGFLKTQKECIKPIERVTDKLLYYDSDQQLIRSR